MTQPQALDILKTGANVFLTGEPGAGKTYLLNEYISWLEDCNVPVAITASTGIASTHIGGMTIHSWSGIGTRNELSAYDLDQIAGKEKMAKRVKQAKVLVIDEISMLDGRVLDMVDAVCQTIKGSKDAFGGLQVILVGDFFQLPPIAGHGENPRFAFESRAWGSARFLTCYLTTQFRQEDDLLLGLLAAIRRNDIDEEHYTLLNDQKEIGYEHIEPTKLYTHNRDVDSVNGEQLELLDTEGAMFKMEARGNKQLLMGLVKNCLSPEVLRLKKEAMVMCTKNNFETGFVNGTLGRVVDFDREDGYPIIETSDKRQIKILPTEWRVEEEGKVLAEITQVPLRLAWAITIHKSQGMSLDAAEIDLRNAFTYGQGYVALSRVRSLRGMKVLGINSQALLVDPRVVNRDEHFREESKDAQSIFEDMDAEELKKMHKSFIDTVGGTWSEGGEKRKKGLKRSVSRESTHEITKTFILKGLSPKDIARERSMALSTVWSHIEKLTEDGMLTKEHFAPLIPIDATWNIAYSDIRKAFEENGVEKLKPVYEALGERYAYDDLRLGRIIFTLEQT